MLKNTQHCLRFLLDYIMMQIRKKKPVKMTTVKGVRSYTNVVIIME